MNWVYFSDPDRETDIEMAPSETAVWSTDHTVVFPKPYGVVGGQTRLEQLILPGFEHLILAAVEERNPRRPKRAVNLSSAAA